MTTVSGAPTPAASQAPRDQLHIPRDWGASMRDPDVRRNHLTYLPAAPTLTLATLGIGVLGTVALRSPRGSWSPRAIARGFAAGGALGVALAGVLLLVDRVSDASVGKVFGHFREVGMGQLLMLVRHPLRPWIARQATAIVRDSNRTRLELFGQVDQLDGPSDAFNHAYGSALMLMRSQRDHGLSLEGATALAAEAGLVHENDVTTDPLNVRRMMDLHNNSIGRAVASAAHRPDGSWMTDAEIVAAVLDHMRSGDLWVANADRTGLRPTTAADVPTS